MSVYEDALVAVRDGILGLGLSGLGIETDAAQKVLIRKMPKVGEVIDRPLPLIFVCPEDGPEEIEPVDFEGQVHVTYLIEVAVVAAGDQDYAANLPTYLGWRERIRRHFMYLEPPAGFWQQRVAPGRPLERGRVSRNYDYQTLTIRLTEVERKG